MRTPELDAWLPGPAVSTRHRREAAATPAELWAAAESVRLGETRTLGRLVRWRIPGTPADQTYRKMFAQYPFTVLEEGDTYSVSGLAGHIWTFARDYPRLDGPQAFCDWDRRGSVRVLFGHWVEPGEDGRSAIVSEARVAPIGKRAELRLRSLWLVVGAFERAIGAEPLALAVRRAELSATGATADVA
jgi:hypothetical protein